MKKSNDIALQLNDQAYMEALIRLRQLIERDYPAGGWLPSGRIMSARLDVSRVTYSKSLSRLVSEGLAVNYPKKGTYIRPAITRQPKIGIIFANGEESPFISMPELLSAITGKLAENRRVISHIIQAGQPDHLYRKALFHCVDNLVWLFSEPSIFPIARTIHAGGVIPFMLVRYFDPKPDQEITCGEVPMVALDYSLIGPQRADFILSHGHKNVVFVGSMWFAEFLGFSQALQRNGIEFSAEYCFSTAQDVTERLPEFLRRKNITAVFSEGNYLEQIFRIVNEMSEDRQPELFLRHHMESLYHRMYPNVKHIWIENIDMKYLGTIAAEQLTANLTLGQPLASVKVPPVCTMEKLD